MNAVVARLGDDDARRSALSQHSQSMLVEAGAGSGKTAVLAGRIAIMLADGIEPRSIAAVTFTELAASELQSRLREYAAELVAGHVAPELTVALENGLSLEQRANLATAIHSIDEITCTTIHGFCQRLIKPYPVEADFDPGATMMDRTHADLAFAEIVDEWLRQRLSEGQAGFLAEMVIADPAGVVALVHKVAAHLRQRRVLRAPAAPPLVDQVPLFVQAATEFQAFMGGASAKEPETVEIAQQFERMAQAFHGGPALTSPHGLIHLLSREADPALCTNTGSFRAYRKKTKWVSEARGAGLAKADGERLNDAAAAHYEACCASWNAIFESAASQGLATLIDEIQPILRRFGEYKRAAAFLDFDDLIFSARALLRDHEEVRQALGRRYSHVLVDEFQDTDPLQTEIVWRLCGDPLPGQPATEWSSFRIRPGALFLVGDPKQAIYRFRGADVGAYLSARETFRQENTDHVLSILTNFRSCASILAYVNERFEGPLSEVDQPGFTPLDHFHADHGEGPCVAALDVAAADENGQASAEQQRDGEAEAVASLCARLIGSYPIPNRRTGEARLCRPGDIALLAPTGADLWRYEEALERRGIPVATQAGKGLFRRQEIQDLIALTRVLADQRDTLALGALLRGPLVGLTEDDLLEVVWRLPRSADDPARIPKLDLNVDPNGIVHPLAREVMQKLQGLRRQSNGTTPHNLLSLAIDVMRVRPILRARHHGQVERALANVDLYLSLANAYAVRGLRAFSEAMTAAWSEESRAVEGRPDAQEEAVALYTMHASKGLEWPVVIPINTITAIRSSESAIVDRTTNVLYCKVRGFSPAGYEAALSRESRELNRERVRLWYVAATRARELLVLPRLDVEAAQSAWARLVELQLDRLPTLDVDAMNPGVPPELAETPNLQTRDSFAAEARAIGEASIRLTWLAPSRAEGMPDTQYGTEDSQVWTGAEDHQPSDLPSSAEIQGGWRRGLILHKLLEEVLTHEIADDAEALEARAEQLIRMMGQTPTANPKDGLSLRELADCVVRTLALPGVAAIRPRLVPEMTTYSATRNGNDEVVNSGIVDALTLTPEGHPEIIIDWKSDVEPSEATLDHYRAQVRSYLDMSGATRGMIVLLTSGQIIEVTPMPSLAR